MVKTYTKTVDVLVDEQGRPFIAFPTDMITGDRLKVEAAVPGVSPDPTQIIESVGATDVLIDDDTDALVIFIPDELTDQGRLKIAVP